MVQGHVAHIGPVLGPTSSWAQVRPKLKWAPVFGWAKYARSFPLYPNLWARAVLVAKRLE